MGSIRGQGRGPAASLTWRSRCTVHGGSGSRPASIQARTEKRVAPHTAAAWRADVTNPAFSASFTLVTVATFRSKITALGWSWGRGASAARRREELIAAGLLMLAGPVDLDELDSWLRVGWERRRRATVP
jgi:hypothetical protein